jgi:hypothetical protein
VGIELGVGALVGTLVGTVLVGSVLVGSVGSVAGLDDGVASVGSSAGRTDAGNTDWSVDVLPSALRAGSP